uniref:Uncharacterized protein n=1 Tax=Arundo donax TaxID=35708 RepID=A0A0A9FN20_ARUDO
MSIHKKKTYGMAGVVDHVLCLHSFLCHIRFRNNSNR